MVRFDCLHVCRCQHCPECGRHYNALRMSEYPPECEVCAFGKMTLYKTHLDVIEMHRRTEIECWEGIVANSQNNRYLPAYQRTLEDHRVLTAKELLNNAHPRFDSYRHKLKEMMHNERDCAQAED